MKMANERAAKRTPLILGHRGYSAKYPENSRLAFQMALDFGADGVECDLHRSKDGRFVVIHDPSLDRTSTSTGLVCEKTWDELSEIKLKFLDGVGALGSSLPAQESHQKLMCLEELLDFFPKQKWLNLEVKPHTVQPPDTTALMETLKVRGPENTLISSFDHRLLDVFKAAGYNIALLIGEEHRKLGVFGVIKRIYDYRPYSVNLPVQLVDELGRVGFLIFKSVVRGLGSKVCFWTVNHPRDLQAIRGAEILITDEVESIRHWMSP